MKLISLVGSLLSLLVLSSAVSAQTASVSGDIRGTISDPSGAVLPKVTVTAVDPQTSTGEQLPLWFTK
ncbi:MAG: hypothetical protein DMG96_41590 [Acidobacteria bacterium]|nr:MAG: hypothetical protein DMG96_41590 [Acidobacteriota bacterium]